MKMQYMSGPAVNSVPVSELRPAEGSGPIFADKQSQVAVWRKARNPQEKLTWWHTYAVPKLDPPNWGSVWPSLLLLSEKFWLWTIFSTMSSASMRVSSTQLGCLSTVSFFLLLQGKTDTNRGEMNVWNLETLRKKQLYDSCFHSKTTFRVEGKGWIVYTGKHSDLSLKNLPHILGEIWWYIFFLMSTNPMKKDKSNPTDQVCYRVCIKAWYTPGNTQTDHRLSTWSRHRIMVHRCTKIKVGLQVTIFSGWKIRCYHERAWSAIQQPSHDQIHCQSFVI